MSLNKTTMAKLQRDKDKQELIPYILEYLKTHTYIKVDKIAYIYIQENRSKYHNSLEKYNFKKKIRSKISSYFAILTRTRDIEQYSKNSTGITYIKTDSMIKGFNDILKESL